MLEAVILVAGMAISLGPTYRDVVHEHHGIQCVESLDFMVTCALVGGAGRAMRATRKLSLMAIHPPAS